MATEARALGRRERKRLETFEEIVEISRRLVRNGDTLTLAAIAKGMGLSPQGIYRYVDSIEAVHALVASDIYRDVVASMVAARDHYPEDDPAARLAASSTAFRSWALANKTEFQIVFANPLTAPRAARSAAVVSVDDEDMADGSKLFADYFAELFLHLHARDLIHIPASSELDPSLLAVIEKNADNPDDPIAAALGPEGVGTLWLFRLAWARLYGTVMIEVFGQIDNELIESGAVYNTLMRETFRSLGLADRWERLAAVSDETAARLATRPSTGSP
jgi:AcrR family transcriptional regulator